MAASIAIFIPSLAAVHYSFDVPKGLFRGYFNGQALISHLACVTFI